MNVEQLIWYLSKVKKMNKKIRVICEGAVCDFKDMTIHSIDETSDEVQIHIL